jgi:hypothetical protein
MRKTLHIEVYYDDDLYYMEHIVDSSLRHVVDAVDNGKHSGNMVSEDKNVTFWTTDSE